MYLYGVIYGNIVYNLVVAIVVIAIALYFKDLLKFERREFLVNRDEASSLPRLLRSKGLRILEERNSIIVDGPLRTTFELVNEKEESENFRVIQSSEVAPWFLSIVIIILALNVALGLALGFLGYLYYRWVKNSMSSIKLIRL